VTFVTSIQGAVYLSQRKCGNVVLRSDGATLATLLPVEQKAIFMARIAVSRLHQGLPVAPAGEMIRTGKARMVWGKGWPIRPETGIDR
jgi:hypothetical protein